MNFRHAMIVAGMLLFLLPALHGQIGSLAVPPTTGGADALAASAARIAELERRIAALEQLRFTPVSGLPASTAPAAPAAPVSSVAGSGLHVVQAGETLSGIARHYGVSVVELERANQLSPGAVIRTGDRLHLGSASEVPPGPAPVPSLEAAAPIAPIAMPSPPAPAASASLEWTGSHVVREGETLSYIARSHGASTAELIRMNGIRDANHIRTGQVLRVPEGQASPPVTSTPPARTSREGAVASDSALPPPASPAPGAPQAEETYHYYDVVGGDTIEGVAKMFYTTPEMVAKLNNMDPQAVLNPGQQLVVPTRRYFEEQARLQAVEVASSSTKAVGPVESQ